MKMLFRTEIILSNFSLFSKNWFNSRAQLTVQWVVFLATVEIHFLGSYDLLFGLSRMRINSKIYEQQKCS